MSSSTTLLGLLGDKSYKIWSQNHTSNALNDLSNLTRLIIIGIITHTTKTNIKVNHSLY